MAERERENGNFSLPVGTVTLLSARLVASHQLHSLSDQAMDAAMERVTDVFREAVGCNEGVRPSHDDDRTNFIAVFARASDAVAAALSVQLADLAPLSLRVGVHTGEVQVLERGNYIGAAVNRCARLCDLAHGGQTLLSRATHDLVVDSLPEGAWLIDLGGHRLHDLTRPEHVHQLAHDDLHSEFPPLRSLDACPNNLPTQLTSFVGRETELSDIRTLLDRARLITLTGSGGCGKTRLALHTAADVLADFRDGAWVAEMAQLSEGELVPVAVASALGVHCDPSRPPVDTVMAHLADKDALVVLDNCEHLVGACAVFVEQVLRSCPSVSMLVTSREPLGVPGEITWRIPSLTLPDERKPAQIGAVSSSEAMQLFADRAERALPGFAITTDNESAVAEICRRLDGIPLAIELAAARVRVIPPDDILRRLHDRFRLLTGGARTAVPRQQTLHASVEWSHQLLTEPERVLFRRLSVFAGTFDVAAVETVASSPPLETHQVLDLLALLVDKSLVATSGADGGARYYLLETVRDHAAEKLEEAGEGDEVRRRHVDHYLTLAGKTFHQFCLLDPAWTAQATEIDNLRAAFRRSQERGDVDASLSLAGSLMPTFVGRGHELEGRQWLDAALAGPELGTPLLRVIALAASAQLGGSFLYWGTPPEQARRHATEGIELARTLEAHRELGLGYALSAGGWVEINVDPVLAVQRFEEAVEMARALCDEAMLMNALGGLGSCLDLAGDPGAARAPLAEAYAIDANKAYVVATSGHLLSHVLARLGELPNARELAHEAGLMSEAAGNPTTQAGSLAYEAMAAAAMGDVDEARGLAQRSLSTAQAARASVCEAQANLALAMAELAAGDHRSAVDAFCRSEELAGGVEPVTMNSARFGKAHALLADGDPDSARSQLESVLAWATTTANKYVLAAALAVEARRALQCGELDEGEEACHRSLAVRREIGDNVGIADCLELLAAFGAQEDRHEEATRLCAAAQSHRDAMRSVRAAVDHPWFETASSAMRDALGHDFDRIWSEGASLTRDDAIAYATRRRGQRKRPLTGWASLTPTEASVACLVGDGLANDEIASRLFVSPRTVQTHLTHIYAKLSVTSRVRLAQEAARHASSPA